MKEFNQSNYTADVIVVDDRYYRVEKYPLDKIQRGNIDILRKGTAYIVDMGLTRGVFPYRGDNATKREVRNNLVPVGIYQVKIKKGLYKVMIRRPITPKEHTEFSLDAVKNIKTAVVDGELTTDDFVDVDVERLSAGESFIPPLYPDDDIMNRIFKTAVRLKDVPFDLYGKRLEASAVSKKSKSSEKTNLRNNAKRAIRENRNLSATKAVEYTTAYDMRVAIIVQDVPGSKSPMFDNGSSLVIYSTSTPFPIDPNKLITVNEALEGEGILEPYTVPDIENEEEE